MARIIADLARVVGLVIKISKNLISF